MDLVTEGLRFPEGPMAMGDGSVILVEIEAGDLTRVLPNGEKQTVAHCGGGPNGAALGPDGAVYVCNNGGLVFEKKDGLNHPVNLPEDGIGGRIQRVDLATGKVESLYDAAGGEPLVAPNDIVFTETGRFYFTDVRRGSIFRAEADGSRVEEVAGEIDLPNGIGLAPDGFELYTVETYAGRMLAWKVGPAGELIEPRRVLYDAERSHGFDSLAVDSEGSVCAANLDDSGVTAVRPDGEIAAKAEVPLHDPTVTNICFGGDDLTTAFITSSGRGRLYRTKWHCPGLKLAHT